ncbi:conserved hypothetical protein [uncultured Thiomicrorhabdus sp.]
MLCLFRNTRFHPKFNPWMLALSWLAVLFWLEFAFIEKELVGKIFAGHAMLVDLVFGLPLVLALAIVIYAMVYWTAKVICIFAFPVLVEQVPDEAVPSEDQEQLIEEAESQFGKDYWQKPQDDDKSSK